MVESVDLRINGEPVSLPAKFSKEKDGHHYLLQSGPVPDGTYLIGATFQILWETPNRRKAFKLRDQALIELEKAPKKVNIELREEGTIFTEPEKRLKLLIR